MSKGPGGRPMNLPPGMLQKIAQLLQSGQWGTPQGFEQLFAGPNPAGGGAMAAGRNRYMREHPQSDPYGWQDWLKGKDFDPYKGITDPVSVDMTDPLKQAKFTAATGLGYGMKGGMQERRGDLGVVDRVNTANALQSLKQAGWDESKGYGPQADLSDKMNQLLFSVSPKYDKSKIPEPVKDPRLSQVYDPFGGMQSGINRDAYVNDTLGGGFYGGVIPEADDQSWDIGDMLRRGMGRGVVTDPHFATPQMNASGKPDLYAGWASNQAQQFGELPYDLFGMQVNDINHPENQAAGFGAGNMMKNPAPATWNGGNANPWTFSTPAGDWSANWGQNSTQQRWQVEPAGNPAAASYEKALNNGTFGSSPWGSSAWGGNTWGNPWGMR